MSRVKSGYCSRPTTAVVAMRLLISDAGRLTADSSYHHQMKRLNEIFTRYARMKFRAQINHKY